MSTTKSTKEFGDRLYQLRKTANLTQQQLAEKLGVGKAYISKLENGKADYAPKQWVLDEIATVFNVPVAELKLLCGVIPDEVMSTIESEFIRALGRAQRSGKGVKVRIGRQVAIVHPGGNVEIDDRSAKSS